MAPVVHRVPVARGSEVTVRVGEEVGPDRVLATRRAPLPPLSVPVARPLGSAPDEAGGLLVAQLGARIAAGEVLARGARGREVRSPVTGILVAYSRLEGAVVVAPLGEETSVLAHVHGRVARIEDGAITINVAASLVRGIEGTGGPVHGELVVAVHDPAAELRAGAIDVGATGKIVVGGSRASAETLTRARAMGVAGIVLGGILDKELRDFTAIQRRRREVGGVSDPFALLLLEGFGKVGIDPQLFDWFRRHAGRLASLLGDERQLLVYDAEPLPRRHALPRVGARVVAHRRPYSGRGGVLVAVLDDLHATASGIATTMTLVRFDDGRLVAVPLANLEATGAPPRDASAGPSDEPPRQPSDEAPTERLDEPPSEPSDEPSGKPSPMSSDEPPEPGPP